MATASSFMATVIMFQFVQDSYCINRLYDTFYLSKFLIYGASSPTLVGSYLIPSGAGGVFSVAECLISIPLHHSTSPTPTRNPQPR